MAKGTSTTSVGNQVGFLSELLRNVRLAWRLLKDPRVPLPVKLILPGAVGVYILSPVDLMPDVIPLLGQIDDLAVLLAGMALFIEMCPRDIVDEHRAALTGRPIRSTNIDEGETVDAEYRVIE